VSAFTGLPINHVAVVDLASFKALIDAIGGINVYVPYASRDANTGFATASGGCSGALSGA